MLARYDDDGSKKLEYAEFAQLVEQLRAFQKAKRAPPPKKPKSAAP